MEGTPPGDALPPPPQQAVSARKGARCGAGAGSTRPHRPRPGHSGRGTLAARSGGRAAGGGTAPDTRRPSQRWKAAPLGTPFRHPHSEQRRPARAHAVGPVLGPHARIDRTRDTRVAEPWLHAPEDKRPGKGQRLTPGAPHNGFLLSLFTLRSVLDRRKAVREKKIHRVLYTWRLGLIGYYMCCLRCLGCVWCDRGKRGCRGG